MIYYFYVLEMDIDGIKKYYVGKTDDIKKRLQNHFRGNRFSAQAVKVYKKYPMKINKICQLNIQTEDKEVINSETSIIENIFVTEQMERDSKNKYNYRGGCYLKPWEENNFKINESSKIMVPLYSSMTNYDFNKELGSDFIDSLYAKRPEIMTKKTPHT